MPFDGADFYQLSGVTVIILIVAFYGGTFLLSVKIGRKKENVDGYMTAGNRVGFGISAASMTATWIWASSFYAAATSGYTYGLSGPIHYGLWGALMILFIYPFGRRIRAVAPKAHTLAEVIHARHGRSSQLILAGSNVLGSVISLMTNFTAAGALISILSPFSFVQGVIFTGLGVLSYTLWSGFRASVLTDFVQLIAMMGAAAIIIPLVFFSAGGPGIFADGFSMITDQQADFFSVDAILNQGAPFFIAVLAYAIGNQTIAQRLFAVREDLIKKTFLTATLGYGVTVIGLGIIGMLALMVGMQPVDGDLNNIIPQMASTYLAPVVIGIFFIMVLGSLSSTADSDLSALSSIMMTDVYGKNIAKKGAVKPKTMLLVGRLTMIVATMLGLAFASLQMDILTLLVFVGALWGALVFPVIMSFYWDRITNAAFSVSVVVALVTFALLRFEIIPMVGVTGYLFESLATIGIGVVIGLMGFGFFGKRAGMVLGVLAIIVALPFVLGFLRDYVVLTSALVAYGMSAVVCTLMTLRNTERFDFSSISRQATEFEPAEPVAARSDAFRS
ncbi:MAG: sodium:solute symporter family protein [Cryobacterium sp.]